MIYFSIFLHFFILGCFSFGGPIAHIGYFRKRFVEKLKWLSDEEFSKIVALSHFLPGPSSSQVGFTIGLKKGGIFGALLAFIAFTLPSFVFLYSIWYFGFLKEENIYILSTIYALKLFAVLIVIDAIIGMFNSFCKDNITKILFIFSSMLLVLLSSHLNQIIILIFCALLGFLFIKKDEDKQNEKLSLPNIYFLSIFLILLIFAFLFEYKNEFIKLFFDFYKSGSLVFGGGHIVLPLLQDNLQNQVSNETFLISYSLAQTVPGPMFTISTYLGADILKENSFFGALISTFGIFIGGFLLILAFYKSYESFSKNTTLSKIIISINVCVVSLLFSTLINTIIPSAVFTLSDILLVVLGLVLIRYMKVNIFYIILGFILFFLVKSIF